VILIASLSTFQRHLMVFLFGKSFSDIIADWHFSGPCGNLNYLGHSKKILLDWLIDWPVVLYCHVEVLGSIPGQGEIYTENSVSAGLPSHSGVMSIYRVFTWSKVRRRGSDWPSPCRALKWNVANIYFNGQRGHGRTLPHLTLLVIRALPNAPI